MSVNQEILNEALYALKFILSLMLTSEGLSLYVIQNDP
jgi:hypothetical protein